MQNTSGDNALSHLQCVEEEYDADIFLYSGEIDDSGFGMLTQIISNGPEHDNALCILVTNGGSPNSAYQIARMFQKIYNEFILYTPSYCKSAGSLIALGAHRLIMDTFSELGPLDVQLASHDEIFGYKSGLTARSAFESLSEHSFELFTEFMLKIKLASRNRISFRLASEIASSMTVGLMSPIYGQINPEIVGSDFRDLSVAVEYGKRLAKTSRNCKRTTVKRLVHKYPSHDFIIDDEEASEIFNRVETPSENLYQLIGALGECAYKEASTPIVRRIKVEEETVAKERDDETSSENATPESEASQEAEEDTILDDSGRANRGGDTSSGKGNSTGNGRPPKRIAGDDLAVESKKAEAPQEIVSE